MDVVALLPPSGPTSGRVVAWLQKEGAKLRAGDSIAECVADHAGYGPQGTSLLVAPSAGMLSKLLVRPGERFHAGAALAELSVCRHPAYFRDLCVSCGLHRSKTSMRAEMDAVQSMLQSELVSKEKVILSGGHSITLTDKEALEMKGLLANGLIKQRKLALILDLDNTLIHAHPVHAEPSVISGDLFHVPLRQGVREDHHLVQRRHGLQAFLSEASRYFQLSVYTHGLRKYAEGIVSNIDPEGVYFGHRIVSWSDVPGVKDQNSRKYGKKSLDNMFLDDWSRVLVMDDREDVWMTGTQHRHLLLVKPFIYNGFREFMELMHAADRMESNQSISSDAVVTTADHTSSTGKDEASNVHEVEEHKSELRSKDPTWVADSDDHQLERCLEILKNIHKHYYDRIDSNNSLKRKVDRFDIGDAPSTADILADMKSHILRGCVLSFSCIFPSHYDRAKIEQQQFWRQAKDLGAVVQHNVTEFTTHLITTQPATAKAKTCFSMRSVHVVHPEWLLNCVWYIRRASEANFIMGPSPSITPPVYVAPAPDNKEVNVGDVAENSVLRKRNRVQEDEVLDSAAVCRESVSGENENDDNVSSSDEAGDEDWVKIMEDEMNEALVGGSTSSS